MNAQARYILMGLVVLAYLPPIATSWQEKGKPRSFVMAAPAREPEAAPYFKAELITPDAATPSVHVASVCEGPDGKLSAAG
jgi:hypothetical protein